MLKLCPVVDRGNNFGCHINIKKQSGSVVSEKNG